MAHPTVLRVPRVGHDQNDDPEFVLVQVVSTAGHNDLDIKLIGTQGTSVFAVSLKSKNTSKLRAKSNQETQEEWDNLLREVLLVKKQGAPTLGVETRAKVDDDSIVITIQKRVEGITQKLGTITLSATEKEEVDPLEWCGQAIEDRDSLREELEALRRRIDEKDDTIRKLQASSDELVRLKNENETQLLEKFSLLLNEKKLKIRDQQRLLADAKVDPAKVEAVEESRLALRSRSAGPSRKGKRKATSKAPASDDESDAGGEKMDVDEEQAANDSDDRHRQTSDEDTADETQSEEDDSAPLPAKKPAAEPTSQASSHTAARAPDDDDDDDDVVPPKRELPFSKKPPAQPSKPVVTGDDSETQSDDEL